AKPKSLYSSQSSPPTGLTMTVKTPFPGAGSGCCSQVWRFCPNACGMLPRGCPSGNGPSPASQKSASLLALVGGPTASGVTSDRHPAGAVALLTVTVHVHGPGPAG